MRITGVHIVVGFYALLFFIVITFKVWLFGSLITSSVKSIAGSCGKTYGVEVIPVVSGNWFCSEESEKK
jgi:hypothetical protein